MKKETEYQYRKRIAELRRENDAFRIYRLLLLEIAEEVATAVAKNETVSRAWLIRQIKRAMR